MNQAFLSAISTTPPVRYMSYFDGVSTYATIPEMTTAADDTVRIVCSIASTASRMICDGATGTDRGFVQYDGASIVTGLGGTIYIDDVATSTVATSNTLHTIEVRGVTAGKKIGVFGGNYVFTYKHKGFIKSIELLDSSGTIKHDWQLDTNTGTFVDKVNPVSNIYIDNAVYSGTHTSPPYLQGVSTSANILSFLPNGGSPLSDGKYKNLITSSLISLVAAATNSAEVRMIAVTDSSRLYFTRLSGDDALIQAGFENLGDNSNLYTIDFTGSSLTIAEMAQLRQDAGDAVGIIHGTGADTYHHVYRNASNWIGLTELQANGDLSSGLTGWTGVGATLSLEDSAVKIAGTTGTDDYAALAITDLVSGLKYQVEATARKGAQGTGQAISGFTWATISNIDVDNAGYTIYAQDVTATAASGDSRFYCALGTGAVGDELFVRKVSVKLKIPIA